MVETTSTAGFWPHLYEPFRALGTQIADFFAPPSEAKSDDAGYEICVELPGVSQDDIHVALDGNQLTVTGEKRLIREETKGPVYFCERQFGAFRRSFRLPPDAESGEIDAQVADGVLTLKIPRKAAPSDKARKIEVHAR